VGVARESITVLYGKGNQYETIYKGEMIDLYYDAQEYYVTFIKIDGRIYPAWIHKDKVVIN